ncbi:MAG: DsbA family protein [Alphaproteobacteria bacterium]|nr:DsbA family protein [Alphaproteobacteria bacterium]
MASPPVLTVYIDVKSPYAYLAIAPTRALAAEFGIDPVWKPYTLEIPDFLGAVETRSEHQWRRVRYSYMDARRLANQVGLTVRGPQKIFDSSIAHIGMLRAQDHDRFEAYIDRVFKRFWKRELEIEDPAVIAGVLEEAGVPAANFAEWAEDEGRQRHDVHQREAEELGVFGVPSYLYREELFWGGDRLGMLRERIEETLAQ